MSSGVPPLARAAITTPLKAAPASVGLPFSATVEANFGSVSWLSEVSSPNFGGVVAHRHQAGVVVHPGAGRFLVLGRDLSKSTTW